MLKIERMNKKLHSVLTLNTIILIASLPLYKTNGVNNDKFEKDKIEFNPPEVQIEDGKIIGTVYKTAKGRNVYSFSGIPYAAPPVNENRFKEPQPIKPWVGKKLTNKHMKTCSQLLHPHLTETGEYDVTGEEDCLYLNVYTPYINKENSSILLDVVLYIHGGAFMYGSGNAYKPKFLLDKTDLVFVSINYRLGPFGFLTMDDEIIPGNNGMKDQVFALKWVKKNIRAFNGNPDKVTITGLSAGGASVHYHFLSEQSRDLFRKGISASGLATNPWALMEGGKNKTLLLANSLNCKVENSSALIECLKNYTNYDILKKIQSNFMPWLFNPFSPFGPTIEKAGKDSFLNRHPYDIISDGKSKKAPWLVSVTSHEGLYPAAEFIGNDKLLNQLNDKWEIIVPHLLDFNYTIPLEKQNMISINIRQNYFKNKSISANTSKELINLISDRLFLADCVKTLKSHKNSSESNIFMYKFSFRGKHSVSNYFSKSDINYGVSHGDDIPYILGCHYDLNMQNEIDMIEIMTDMWISFIKTSSPNIGNHILWEPISNTTENDAINYLEIKSCDDIQMKIEKNFGNNIFWDKLEIR